jgi:hypothetical protein
MKDTLSVDGSARISQGIHTLATTCICQTHPKEWPDAPAELTLKLRIPTAILQSIVFIQEFLDEGLDINLPIPELTDLIFSAYVMRGIAASGQALHKKYPGMNCTEIRERVLEEMDLIMETETGRTEGE